MRNKDGTYDKYQITLDNDDNPYFEYVDRFDVEFTRGPRNNPARLPAASNLGLV